MKKNLLEKSIVIFGAGKIGRSFIGQLFGCSGYQVVFIDVDQNMIDKLNALGSYRVIVKGESETEILVPHVRAISALDKEQVAVAISEANILAVSVGKNVLEKVIPSVAEGLRLRFDRDPDAPLDIIIAENMRSADHFIREKLEGRLSDHYPLDRLVGLVETSIGKMVPIMTASDLEKDPLAVFAEPYNTLIVDGKAFKSGIPDVKGLAPKENIKAWVDRKAFIHNLGHATAAYFGSFKYPEAIYMYEILGDEEVVRFTRETMQQAAASLQVAYPDDFKAGDLDAHIDDLLFRFKNKALKDTIFRVGHDLVRKLGADDRFIGAVHLAMETGMFYDKILEAASYAFSFDAKDEHGNYFQPDVLFKESLSVDFKLTMTGQLGLDPSFDSSIISDLKRLYQARNKQVNE
jgi:mannitol-1-phosphate 5-dehydrogenase